MSAPAFFVVCVLFLIVSLSLIEGVPMWVDAERKRRRAQLYELIRNLNEEEE